MLSNTSKSWVEILFIISVLFTCTNSVQSHAFCDNTTLAWRQSYFPLENPERHIPWVWDAVYDEKRRVIDIITIPRKTCHFNSTTWQRAVKLFPEYAHQLGDGLFSNILVSIDEPRVYDYTGLENKNQGILTKYLNCSFYKSDHLVYKGQTLQIRGDPIFSSIGSIHVRCPVPRHLRSEHSWDRVRLERSLDMETETIMTRTIQVSSQETNFFPVCNIPSHLTGMVTHQTVISPQLKRLHSISNNKSSGTTTSSSSSSTKQYGVSICTASARADRSYLVEWIEYHRLIGVDHFFIYDTSVPSSRQGRIAHTLADYIRDGIVTIVPWPYQNCVRNMASGRGTWWAFDNPHSYFQPPRAIAQTAALASCYTRYRSTSKYIAHIDDDEFFAFDSTENDHLDNSPDVNTSSTSSGGQYPTVSLGGLSSIPLSASSGREARQGDVRVSLFDIAERTFAENPRSPALRVSPVDKYHCPSQAASTGMAIHSLASRLLRE